MTTVGISQDQIGTPGDARVEGQSGDFSGVVHLLRLAAGHRSCHW